MRDSREELLEAQLYLANQTIAKRDTQIAELKAENEHLRSVQECHGIDLRERDNAIKSYVAGRDELTRQLTEAKANTLRIAFIISLSDEAFGDLMNSPEMMPEQFVICIDAAMKGATK